MADGTLMATFVIVFRETLEAALIVGIVLTVLARLRCSQTGAFGRRPPWLAMPGHRHATRSWPKTPPWKHGGSRLYVSLSALLGISLRHLHKSASRVLAPPTCCLIRNFPPG